MGGKVKLTMARIQAMDETQRGQTFLWDSEQRGLGIRATKSSKAFVWQGLYQGQSIRITIGKVGDWKIAEAAEKAREFQRQVDVGHDPRQLKQEAITVAAAKVTQAKREEVLIADAWAAYISERREFWGERHTQCHEWLAQAGGQARARSPRKTVAGPLLPFMQLRLIDLAPAEIESWAGRNKKRLTAARLALRCFKAFLRWAADEDAYAGLVAQNLIGKKVTEKLGKPKAKDDALLKEQLPVWFDAVCRINNPVIAAYLQILLLTGARREELLGLKWADVNMRWNSLSLRDKAESSGGEDGTRVIPMTPYVKALLGGLPKRNRWVFSSPTSKNGQLRDPYHAHADAMKLAGLSITLHGLRRSFSSLSEWLELPVGVVYQIMGHKPSATAEKHYKKRPLDMLHMHHERLEAFMIEAAGISMPHALEGQRRLKAVR